MPHLSTQQYQSHILDGLISYVTQVSRTRLSLFKSCLAYKNCALLMFFVNVIPLFKSGGFKNKNAPNNCMVIINCRSYGWRSSTHIPYQFQNELDDVVRMWNSHRIRPARNQASPNGRPFMLYSCPAARGTRQHPWSTFAKNKNNCAGKSVLQEDRLHATKLCTKPVCCWWLITNCVSHRTRLMP